MNRTDYWYPCAFSSWGEEEREAIARVISSGRFTMGEEVESFEAEFASFHGMKHAIMVNSGSSANLVAVAALFHKKENPLRPGDKAIVPALAWGTTYAPLVQLGLDLVLIDADDTWCAEKPFNRPFDQARLVIGCSILGNPAHLALWREYARHSRDCYFMEDNCESLGAIDYDAYGAAQLCGTFGLLNTLSFYHSHQLSAIEGGMILTDNDEMNELCRMLRDHGLTRWRRPESFADEYDFRLMGYNVRPLEMHAAIAREQLKKPPQFTEARRTNAMLWRELTADIPIVHPKINGVWNPFGLHFEVEDAARRPALVSALRANGIDCRLPTGGSFTRHAYGAPWRDQPTPRADLIHDRGLFLGNAPFAIDDKIEKAASVMRKVLA